LCVSEYDGKNTAAKNGSKKSIKKAIASRTTEDIDMKVPVSDEGIPIVKKKGKTNGKKTAIIKEESEDSESDVPLAKLMSGKDSEVDIKKPTIKTTSKNVANAKMPDSQRKKKKEDSPEESMSAKKRGKQKVKEEDSDNEDDEEFKWWNQQNDNNDGSDKWTTLEHNGVYFPPPYVPHNVKMKYDGKEITLEPEAEEVASFYAAMLGTDYVTNETFNKNFFKDWQKVLKKSKNNHPIKDFEKCDFTPIFEYFEQEKERKKNMSKEEKAKLKEEKIKLEEKYGYCLLDGRKEKVGNFRIEPPGLFRGRGAHPKTGSLKFRVQPEQVTINIGKGAKIPSPPAGHKWAGVIHDPTVTWLATWKENVNDNIKYVFLAANSSLKGLSDMKKFEKARELKKHIGKIRNDYQANLRHKNTATRQMATAMYLIDRLALRAGNEKDTNEEADTVGCCSLRPEHVTLIPPNTVRFDFLGKDSIRYINTVEVEDQVFRNLSIFMKGKDEPEDLIFDRVNTQELNKHLSSYMKGLTAKVFRTYNASHTFQTQLNDLTQEDSSVAEKIFAYNQANRQVAILCNHQRSVSKAHGNQMSKIEDKIKAFKYQRMKLKKAILALEPKLRKKRSELLEEESDLDEEWIIEYEKQLMEKERERVQLKALLHEVDQKEKELERERISGKVEPKKGLTVEKAEEKIQTLNAKIKETKLLKDDKESNKTTALGTSKINYIDPRISAAWCLKYKVPYEKIFNKSLRDKFKWAMDIVDADWRAIQKKKTNMIENAALIKQGAEARVYTATFLTRTAIIKERFPKTYRHPILDNKLTTRRVLQEARCLFKCYRSGVDTPILYFVDIENNAIYMEFVKGKTLKDLITEIGEWSSKQLTKKIGIALSKMHAADVIHGDLTTSNLLLRESNNSLVVIDFGLSYISSLPEDKAVDLYVLEKTFLSTHPNSEAMFAAILETYKSNYKASKDILSKLAEEGVSEVWLDNINLRRL
ncbi:21701_t:CDS:10, partial [Racocetra persica]